VAEERLLRKTTRKPPRYQSIDSHPERGASASFCTSHPSSIITPPVGRTQQSEKTTPQPQNAPPFPTSTTHTTPKTKQRDRQSRELHRQVTVTLRRRSQPLPHRNLIYTQRYAFPLLCHECHQLTHAREPVYRKTKSEERRKTVCPSTRSFVYLFVS